ncbi:FAD-dependent oxidoreductase [Nocardioides guangzhouensis]|uniref:FAD-dependent oxidoreductase n=1 Tax=Nocardioides guangzhouensis TaxID=2497878 RepID=A0A4Q4Z6N3_9ACTN|nr:FAD-dependent monooxygenase [Nocardioides guangzhouensis]RYP82696.1 FAD-dependent oxidoreductase [Nocardioides guangzhouensis]
MSLEPDVLVVGAGPTGLTTALQAHAHGARVRVVERRPDAFRPSRAMVVHSRTLEVLRPLGVTEELLDRGDRAPRAELHLGDRTVRAALADVALRDTAYPHLTLVRQADVEEVLAAALARRGVGVERGVELTDAAVDGDRVHATLRSDGALEQSRCRYVAGCDGPDSLVRRIAGIAWRGRPYREEVILADLDLDGHLAPDTLHVAAGRPGLVFLFALGEGAAWRLLATRPAGPRDAPYGQPGGTVPAPEVQRLLDESGLAVRIGDLAWSARIRLQHRLAGSFRAGPFFVAGDAAHTHSPAAAQGMNTGIVDAVNLGWKLAWADGSEHPSLLDSYDLERRPAAGQALALTHAVFFAEASSHPLPSLLRGTLVPLVAPALPTLMRQPHLMAAVVALLSQRWVRYRSSPLSRTGTPRLRGPRPGDRLPDQEVTSQGRRTRLHDLTAAPGIHLLLDGDARVDPGLLGPRVTAHRIDDWPGAGMVAVRPDGHVGYRSGSAAHAELGAWLALVGAAPSGHRR